MNAIAQSHIRNFSTIAHIDHGKSTLADRLIQQCGGLSPREMKAQVLDSMAIERERGITVKAQTVTLQYTAKNSEIYQFNVIDTPGHVDFSYEVSRSLSACEGALLLVDAGQGVEAQTVATCYMAIEQNLVVLPVLNKIDLPQANPERVMQEIEDVIGLDTTDAMQVSAKTGRGVDALLEKIIYTIPPPVGEANAPLQALIIDSWFDNYLGVVSLVRIKQGTLNQGQKIRVMSTGKEYRVEQIGIFTPKRTPLKILIAGAVGFVIAGVKDIFAAPVGDTLTSTVNPAQTRLAGFERIQPRVFAGLFPVETDDFEAFREALAKLRLNDAALSYEPESSEALGFGFRCGFLGLLHMEIVQERLEREYHLELITSAPTVIYEILTRTGDLEYVDNPMHLPVPNHISEIREPMASLNILVPQEYLGSIMTLCAEKRGVQTQLSYLSNQVTLSYNIPMSEIILDFFNRAKSVSHGYASLDYSFNHFQAADLVKLDILINGQPVDSLANIVHRDQAYIKGRDLTERLQTLIPRQMFEIMVQAAIGSKVIARATIKALRKNVTAKCYGGDVSRKRKLLEKQKAGKKRMKQVGKVAIPQEAFLAILKIDEGQNK